MSEKKIKESIDAIEPEVGAKERMYQNILKKAQQSSPAEKLAEPKKKPISVWYALPIAACLCLVVIGIARFLPGSTPAQPDGKNVQIANPFVEVENAEAFKALSVTLDAPEGAQEISYAIIDGKIAEIQFKLDGKSYLVRASAQKGDFTGLNGKDLTQETIDAKNNAVLTAVQTDLRTYYKIVWTNRKINYCLYGTDGADKDQVFSVYEVLKK